MDYFFEDFTLENYKSLIRLAKKNYNFKNFNDALDISRSFVLWRHDIDFSVHMALNLANIEFEEKVKSTFFVQLNSDFYNIFEFDI